MSLVPKRRFTKHGRRIVPRGKDTDNLHRRYKVMRLPMKVRAAIFRGYADGEPYEKICADVEKMGYHIDSQAVGNYWRDVWKKQHKELEEAQSLLAVLTQSLGLKPGSPKRVIAQELLYTLVFLAFPLLKKEGPLALLREAREQEKGGGKSQPQPTGRKSLKQHLEQLYGPGVVVEEEVESSDPEDETR